MALTYIEFYSGIGGWSLALEKACRDINSDANIITPSSAEAPDESMGGTSRSTSTSRRRRRRLKVQRLASYDHSDLCNSVYAHNFVDDSFARRIDDDPTHATRPRKKQSSAKSSDNTRCAFTTSSARRPPPTASLPSFPIEKLTVDDLAKLNADIWAMSPPCQPHTRQHDKHSKQEELNDPRSRSFLHLISLLNEFGQNNLPRIILLENVVGFEASASCNTYKSALTHHGYVFAEFHLNPTQMGISNDRPRYYSVAVRRNQRQCSGGDVKEDGVARRLVDMMGDDNISASTSSDTVHTSILPLNVADIGAATNFLLLPTIASYLDRDLPPLATGTSTINQAKMEMLQISNATIAKSASWCFDIITKDDARSSCFTSSYGKYVKGTGSVLYYGGEQGGALESSQGEMSATTCSNDSPIVTDSFGLVDPQNRVFDAKWWEGLVGGRGAAGDGLPPLRYLSGTEVARLMGFPLKNEDGCDHIEMAFDFPHWCAEKQKWRLLGNSINVAVSSRISEVGIRAYSYGNEDGSL